MKRGRLPLTALRCFEVAGRLSSFTRAAEELHVSQAAISRQVRELESLIGQKLFERRHRAVHLTDAGRTLLNVLSGAFDDILVEMNRLMGPSRPTRVSINSEPTFAALWLIPHLPSFYADHPDIEVHIETDTRLVDFRTDAPDLAIRHSRLQSDWPRLQARTLSTETLSVLLSPQLIDTPLVDPTELLKLPLLHEESRNQWTIWMEAAGLTNFGTLRGTILADGALVAQAALRGQGVCLSSREFLADDIAAGRLISPFDLEVPCGRYFLVAPSFDAMSAGADKFACWIETEFARSAAP